MIFDVFVILFFLISLWIGWAIRISIDWLRLVWIILFTILITVLLPYFIAFVENSSANFSVTAYYFFGIMVTVLIFLCFYLLIRKNKLSSSGLRRFAGSLVLAAVSTYSFLIILVAMAEYKWINVAKSTIITNLPNWILAPFK